jgi:hypothetical protein
MRLWEKVKLEAEEKFNHSLSNSSDIHGLQVDLMKLENRLLYMPQDEKQRSVIVKRLDELARRLDAVESRDPIVAGPLIVGLLRPADTQEDAS